MDSRDDEQLQQDASTHYLSGEYQAAIDCWREVLSRTPDDPQALDGIRMCEQLVGTVESSVCTANVSPFSVSVETVHPEAADLDLDRLPDPEEEALVEEVFQMAAIDPAFGESVAPAVESAPAHAVFQPAVDESLDDLGDLDMLDLGSMESPAPMEAAGGDDLLDLSDLQDDDSLNDDLSLEGWLDDPSTAAPSVPVTPSPVADPVDDVPDDWSWGKSDTDSNESKAEIELRRRVNELLASALVFMEKGEPDEALRNLDRLLILEEANETALALKHKILRGDIGEAAADDRFAPRASESTSDQGVKLDLAELYPDSSPSTADADDDAPLMDLEEDYASAPDEQDEPRVLESDTSVAVSDTSPGASKGKSIAIAAVLLVALAGVVAWKFLGTSSPEVPVAEIPEATPPVETEPVPVPVPRRMTPVDPKPDPRLPVQVDVAAILGSGHDAMQARDYAAAVVAFNKVLAIEPHNPEARATLNRAGEEYRKQKERDRQRILAVEAFKNQDYHAALRMLYRLSDVEDPQRIETYKFNGWYNLGLTALKAGNCDRAHEHLTEAASIGPSNPALAAAFGQVVQCKQGWGPGFRDSVERMSFRGIED